MKVINEIRNMTIPATNGMSEMKLKTFLAMPFDSMSPLMSLNVSTVLLYVKVYGYNRIFEIKCILPSLIN
jgi:hypothetical protein